MTYTAVGSRIQGSTIGLLAGTISEQATLENVTVSGKLLIDPSLFIDGMDVATYGMLTGAGNVTGLSLENIKVEATGDNKNGIIITTNKETGEITLTVRERN